MKLETGKFKLKWMEDKVLREEGPQCLCGKSQSLLNCLETQAQE